MKKILWLIMATTIYLLALPADINHMINKSKLPKKDISIYIKDMDSNRVIASLNSNVVRKPASVVKVMTTYASVLKLNFWHRFPTQFYTKGKITGGILNGDLIIKGFGDPTLSNSDLPSIINEIKQKGIKRIKGNIIIDRTYFKVSGKNSSHFDNNVNSPYNAMPDAMMFNERTSSVFIVPKKNMVRKVIPNHSYTLVNNIKFIDKPCKGKYSWAGSRVSNSSSIPKLILSGQMSKRCGTRKVTKVVCKPHYAFYYALVEKMKKNNISFKGKLELKKVPADAKILFTHYSKTLEKIISKTAKKSNNLYARQLLLYLGAKMYGAPATLAKGRKAIKYMIKNQSSSLYIDNGSGLSRESKMTAQALAKMYEQAYYRYGQRWMKTLSIAGVDGTIRRRFRGTVAHNRAWMKTGTLNRVKNIGGYVKNRGGKLYSLVILVNTKHSRWKASQLQNNIIKWLAKSTRKVSNKRKKKTVIKKRGEYFIQVASLSYKPSSSYLRKIKNMGFDYKLVHKKRYNIYIGSYRSDKEARKHLTKAKRKLNRGSFIVKL